MRFLYYGWIPEWPKGADCKSVGDAFEGSNPSPSIQESRGKNQSGSNPSPSIQERRHLFKKAEGKTKAVESFSYNETNSEYFYAAVAELADAQDLKSCGGDIVPVRFRSAALRLSASNPYKSRVWAFFFLEKCMYMYVFFYFRFMCICILYLPMRMISYCEERSR